MLGANEPTSAVYTLPTVPYLPPPILVWSAQLLQMSVPPDGMLQVQIRALELALQRQRRVQVRHGSIHNAHGPEGIRCRKVGGGKGGDLQSQALWRLEVEQRCRVAVSHGSQWNGR